MNARPVVLALAVALVIGSAPFHAADPVRYAFSFPQPAQGWLQVEATFDDLGDAPLELQMSRASPGRYGAHDFAANVYDVRAFGPDGNEVRTDRTGGPGWTVPRHDGRVIVRYKVYGNRVDGTYLAVDPTHAHINMPAAVMWARGLEDRPATVTFDLPAEGGWQIATQLFGAAPSFSAPNLQYLMDSPVELGPVMIESFTAGRRTFRVAAHHTGTRADLRQVVADVARIAGEQEAIFGGFPVFEPGAYTFLVDALPSAAVDAMEHRNSTVITTPGTFANARAELLESASHELFHVWNVERIRPRSLEPFDFARPNESAELWLAEGFTQYYGPLAIHRAGLMDVPATARVLADVLNAVNVRAGRLVRSAEEISRMAATAEDALGRLPSGVVSYYYLGAAIALALDLTLRDRTDGRVTLDHFMRRLWVEHGVPGGSRPGYVDRPYTMADAEAALAAVAGDAIFAREFFGRYITGRELADYTRLLGLAGFLVRPAPAGRIEVLPEERTGTLGEARRSFRNAWLGPRD